ncbi:MAG: NAD(P)H-dependent oxidoreductase subunit E [Deltaproteobacteria bacterium]|uniref:NAD(P)H-dependent oxidoreductase subunit E n=1 Tax=Candidatus Zymogenus saltonus TaxID=2844893 RepID=A0A9D8KEX4_9DELT|nr:NAD(P)H-dependent oxidoreductase subunit E [Candidatus Zymogenus saltonus]
MNYSEKSVDKIVKDHNGDASKVILMLQDVQSEFRYIPREAVKKLSDDLDIPEARIYHIATFYKAFSLVPRGEHEIRVCLGTACHIKGGKRIAEGFERALKVKAGETTKDKKFTLETVNCLGACALAPLVQVDEENHSKMTIEKIDKVLKQYKK